MRSKQARLWSYIDSFLPSVEHLCEGLVTAVVSLRSKEVVAASEST